MRKILFYINNRKRGGAQRVMVELANYLADNHLYSVIFVEQFYSEDGDYRLNTAVKEIVLETPESKKGLSKQLDRIQRLNRLCKEIKPDIIISFLNVPNLIALAVGKKQKIPVIISIRSDPKHDHSRVLHVLMRRIYPWAAGWVFQTEEAENYFKKWIKGKKDIIVNPLSAVVAEEIEHGKITGENSQNIVTAGRLSREKRQDMLINAYYSIADRHNDTKLVIYGEGPEKANLERLIEKLNLEGRVILAGATENIIEKIRSARLFVFSSAYEGMPNALIEAMAVGLPVISTDCPCGGPAMLIENNVNGILVPVDNETELAKQIDVLLTDEKYARKLGERAKNITAICKMESVAEQWCKMIEKCSLQKEE